MIVSTGLTVPVAVTARVTAPPVTGAVEYCTGLSPPSVHQAIAAASSSASGVAISPIFRNGARAGAPIFAPSAAGAGTSIGAVPVVTGLFIVELRLRPPDRTLAEWPENPLISIKTLRIRANRPEPVRPADNALRLRHGLAFPAFPGAGEPMALARLDEACFLRVHIGDQRVHTHRFGLQGRVEREEDGAAHHALQRRSGDRRA